MAGDWKAASFVVFTAAAVLSMSEPSKGRLFLPFEELSLALRRLCVQDSTGWSTKSAPHSRKYIQRRPGRSQQTYS